MKNSYYTTVIAIYMMLHILYLHLMASYSYENFIYHVLILWIVNQLGMVQTAVNIYQIDLIWDPLLCITIINVHHPGEWGLVRMLGFVF